MYHKLDENARVALLIFIKYVFALAYYFKLPDMPDISNHFFILKTLRKKKWQTSSIVVRPLFTIGILFSLP